MLSRMRYGLRDATADSSCEIILEDNEVRTTVTKAGGKPRTRSQTQDSIEDARKAAQKALDKQLKAGFVLDDGGLPHPAMFYPPSPDEVTWTLLAKNARKAELLVNQLPALLRAAPARPRAELR